MTDEIETTLNLPKSINDVDQIFRYFPKLSLYKMATKSAVVNQQMLEDFETFFEKLF